MKSLTDVVSGAGLSVYAEIALVIFLIAFLGIVISLFAPGKQRTHEHLRHLPMAEDSDSASPSASLSGRSRSLASLGTTTHDPSLRSGRQRTIPRYARDDNHA